MIRIPALLVVFMLGFIGTAWAQGRVALVIGNSIYDKAPKLANPGNDSADIAASLTRLGFKVQLHSNLDFQRMNQALRDFARASRNSEMAVVYYAGHGIEVDKKNWLIPTDAQLASDADVEFETVSLDLLSQAVSGASVLRLVMVDACRENPFARQMNRQNATRSIGRGLGRVEDPGPGTLVVFAAAEGQLAEDGTGRNSPFATALLAEIEKPGNEVGSLFRKVRDDVMARTANRQQPFQYGSLPGRDIFFTPPDDTRASSVNEPIARPDFLVEIEYWNSIKDSGDREILEGYLKRYPDGLLSTAAREKLTNLDEDIRSKKQVKHDSAPERLVAGESAGFASRFSLNGLTVGGTAPKEDAFVRWDQEWTFPRVAWVRKLDNGHVAYVTEGDNKSGKIVAIAKSFLTKNIETKEFYELLSSSFGKWSDFSSYKSDPYWVDEKYNSNKSCDFEAYGSKLWVLDMSDTELENAKRGHPLIYLDGISADCGLVAVTYGSGDHKVLVVADTTAIMKLKFGRELSQQKDREKSKDAEKKAITFQ